MLADCRLEDVILLDNKVLSFAWQLENGIFIPSFYGDPLDEELPKIARFLISIVAVEDVRIHVVPFAGIVRLYRDYRPSGYRPYLLK